MFKWYLHSIYFCLLSIHGQELGVTKMIKTTHFMKRTSQRGITKAMVNYALEHGEIDGDKLIVNRKLILRHRAEVLRELAVMAKLLDKGGIVVVSEYESLITAYDFDSRKNKYS